jgi:hypothetical protein
MQAVSPTEIFPEIFPDGHLLGSKNGVFPSGGEFSGDFGGNWADLPDFLEDIWFRGLGGVDFLWLKGC